ncbi:curli assembly protein CsgF [Pseudomonas sp. NPDC088368]|jgi:curli production assembly/transport component CsgF|uniref:curli assembly protein CsgF n=1 Tax=unclassified Pseudomonas TaxID=196821 RepID=UPI001413256C|nr:curli assembly protein CsgF [Pseudomonas sp. SLFW]NBB10242.1 curli assembly protein CsgF [Pseudomonas sp. SLFW]
MNRLSLAFISLLSLSGPCASVLASELVYVPVNPSFGGNPLNGPVLLNQANAQNKFTEKSSSSGSTQSTLNQFNSMLQSAILSRVSSAVTSSIVGTDGKLTPGTVETTDFTISIVNLSPGLLQITTTDKTTGQSTSFQINQ